MNYANIKWTDIADGPGVRVSVFVSGCPHHCPGCFNEVAWPYNYGDPFTKEVEDSIITALQTPEINGLTLLGGEPLAPPNQRTVLKFVQRVREEVPNTSIWLYTGYTYEDIRCGGVGICAQLMMEYLDVLVDGPFIQEKKDISLLFRGSSNQRLIDMKKTKWGTGDGTIYLWHD